ncbi:hypothetical protein HUJ04_008941 [Dendroctonus ponderosae]
MGSNFSSQAILNTMTNFVSGTKRKRLESEEDELNKVIDIVLHTPKKIKLSCTAKYIYQALFVEGKNSDVTVCALGKEYYLHRVYLCQSPYFGSMFGGSWLETTQKYITIDVVDPAITQDSLKVVFGSLYEAEVVLNPLEVLPIMATATMFQLDGLIEQCTELMLETINPKTCLDYYNAACLYGDKKLEDACIRWFLVNLMPYYYQESDEDLRTIPVSLMETLMAQPDLCTIQTECSLYVMLKHWVYLIHHPEESKPTASAVAEYFSQRQDKTPFLHTPEGRQFVNVFQELRIPNLINHHLDIELILGDNIIPKSWLNTVVIQQWDNMLRVNHNEDKGPLEVSQADFLKQSVRCGRIVLTAERHVWRWTGFYFGVDLLVALENNMLSVRRNHRSELEQLLSFQTQRNVAVLFRVVRLNEQKQITYSKESNIMLLSLAKGQEVPVMSFDKVVYPIIVTANMLFIAPEKKESVKKDD